MDLDKTPEEIKQNKANYAELLHNRNYEAIQERKSFRVYQLSDLDLTLQVDRLSDIHKEFTTYELMQMAAKVDTSLSVFISENGKFALKQANPEINPFDLAYEISGKTLEHGTAFVLLKS